MSSKGIESIEKVNVELSSAVFGKRQTDLLYKIEHADGESYLFLLLEHQTDVDNLMPLRILVYMTRIWERVVREEKGVRRKDYKLPMIIPVVFYEGRKDWNVPLNFKGKVRVVEGLDRFVPSFEYQLLSVKDVELKELERNLNALSVMIAMDESVDVGKILGWIRKVYDRLSEEERDLIRMYARSIALGIAKRAGLEGEKEIERALMGDEEGMEMFGTFIEYVAKKVKEAEEAKEKLKRVEEELKRAREMEEKTRRALLDTAKVLLRKRFGEDVERYLERLEELSSEDIERIIENIFDLKLEDLERFFK